MEKKLKYNSVLICNERGSLQEDGYDPEVLTREETSTKAFIHSIDELLELSVILFSYLDHIEKYTVEV